MGMRQLLVLPPYQPCLTAPCAGFFGQKKEETESAASEAREKAGEKASEARDTVQEKAKGLTGQQ